MEKSLWDKEIHKQFKHVLCLWKITKFSKEIMIADGIAVIVAAILTVSNGYSSCIWGVKEIWWFMKGRNKGNE